MKSGRKSKGRQVKKSDIKMKEGRQNSSNSSNRSFVMKFDQKINPNDLKGFLESSISKKDPVQRYIDNLFYRHSKLMPDISNKELYAIETMENVEKINSENTNEELKSQNSYRNHTFRSKPIRQAYLKSQKYDYAIGSPQDESDGLSRILNPSTRVDNTRNKYYEKTNSSETSEKKSLTPIQSNALENNDIHMFGDQNISSIPHTYS
jgi:hypothetical protein